MPISEKDRLICKQRNRLDCINKVAVQLRDDIGTGTAVAALRERVHEIVEMTRVIEDSES